MLKIYISAVNKIHFTNSTYSRRRETVVPSAVVFLKPKQFEDMSLQCALNTIPFFWTGTPCTKMLWKNTWPHQGGFAELEILH